MHYIAFGVTSVYRLAAAYLLVSLVPSQSFRTNYRAASLKLQVHTSHRDLSDEATLILHTILNLLLRLLRPARVYTDILVHGPGKLSAYFGLMTYCMVSKTEKLMVCGKKSTCQHVIWNSISNLLKTNSFFPSLFGS